MNQQIDQQNDPFFAPFSEGSSDFQPLQPGAYNGVCIGVTIRDFPDFNDKSKMLEKAQFIFEVVNGEEKHFLRSAPMRLVITDKSKLFLFVTSWTQATLDHVRSGFSCGKMIGFGAQLIITNKANDGKVYNEIANVLPLQKGVQVPVVPAEIPEYLVRNVKQQAFANGITIMQPKVESTFAAPASAKAMPAQVATTIGDSSAFFGQGQVSQGFATPNSEVPVAPSNPNYVGGQVSAPSPYVAPQRKDGTFVPAPAPAPQPQMFGQATTPAGNTYTTQAAPQVAVDPGSDLPF